MIHVGIDVAKDKHDCFITNSNGEVLFKPFTIANSMDGFNELLEKIKSITSNFDEIKVGLEATGHYSYNILGFLLKNNLLTFVINPLHTNLYRKSISLRKTKTDKVDAMIIAHMLMSNLDLKPYSLTSYHNEELKSLTRYRFDKVRDRAKLKTSIKRLINILFPELESLVKTVHMKSVYDMLYEFPSAKDIAHAHLTRVANLIQASSKGRFSKDKAIIFRTSARNSIGIYMPAKALELKHTIKLIRELDNEIDEVEVLIKNIMDELNSPLLSIPGISYRMGAMILAEIGDFNKFSSPDKILAYAGMSPSTYQSGQLTSSYSHMEKRGSKYLRFALFNATKFVCNWDESFASYLLKKRNEGKHYNVAISHATKKLVRLIYALEKSSNTYRNAA